SEHNCRIILSKIELLTIAPIQEIPIAIRYLNSLTTVQPELISFWSYFDLIWRRRFEPQLWNISNINHIDIGGQTIPWRGKTEELERISLMHTKSSIFYFNYKIRNSKDVLKLGKLQRHSISIRTVFNAGN
ncbi:LOW QUALITY PROTEIN: hypothetical protein HZS_6574, partial [Henneguya salminicola]